MKWSGLTLTAVVVLGFASVVSAESAWVLWMETDSSVGTAQRHSSRIVDTFPTREACEADIAGELSLQNLMGKQVTKDGTVLEIVGGGTDLTLRFESTYRCLPDSVNPNFERR